MASIVQISLFTLHSSATGDNFPQVCGGSLNNIKIQDSQKWAFLTLTVQVSSLTFSVLVNDNTIYLTTEPSNFEFNTDCPQTLTSHCQKTVHMVE